MGATWEAIWARHLFCASLIFDLVDIAEKRQNRKQKNSPGACPPPGRFLKSFYCLFVFPVWFFRCLGRLHLSSSDQKSVPVP